MNFKSFYIYFTAYLLYPVVKCDENYSCFQSKNDETLKQSLKPFKNSFSVDIEFVDLLKRSYATDFDEYYDYSKNVSSLMHTDNDGNDITWLFNKTTKTFTFYRELNDKGDYNCTTKIWTSPDTVRSITEDSPLFLPLEILWSVEKTPIFGLADFYELFTKSTNVSRDVFNHDDDHGLDVDHVTGCSKTPDGYFVEFSICITKDRVKLPTAGDMRNVPTRIQLKIYNGTSSSEVTVVFNGIYEMSGYQYGLWHTDAASLLPPCGVHCDGWPDTLQFPQLPKHFSLNIEYFDENRVLINNELFIDDNKMAGFIYNHKNDDEPMTLGLVDILPNFRYRIVHDFESGLQYVLNDDTKSCHSVVPIPSGSSDVFVKASILEMQNTRKILYSGENLNFTYIGEKYVGVGDSGGTQIHVWTAPLNSKELNKNVVYEVQFVERSNQGGTLLVPFSMIVYHRENSKSYYTTKQHFYNFVIYGDNDLSMRDHLNVLSCLTMSTNDSYLMLQINGTSKDVTLAGKNLYNELTEKLSSLAKVGFIRVQNLFFQPNDNDKKIFVYFQVADFSPLGVDPAPTVLNRNQTKTSEAKKLLNDSIFTNDVTFEVPLANGKMYFTIQKGSLNYTAPYYYRPKSVDPVAPVEPAYRKGYTGGSMAALAICMLLIGGVCGLAGAFYKWKRNRGIVYHIYE